MSNLKIILGAIALPSLITIVFTILKLVGKIDWSWLWVLSPIWIWLSIGVIGIVLVIIIASMIEKMFRR